MTTITTNRPRPPMAPFWPSTWASTRASPAFTPGRRRYASRPSTRRAETSCAGCSSRQRPAVVHHRGLPAGRLGARPVRRTGRDAAWWPTPPARPGSSSTSNARPTRTMPCVWRELYVLGQLPTVTVPARDACGSGALIAARQTLVGRRVAVQNRIRSIFVGQGLPAPRGAKAWSTTGPGRDRDSRPSRWPSAAPTSCGVACCDLALTELPPGHRADRPGGGEARRAGQGQHGRRAVAADDSRRRAAHGRGGGRLSCTSRSGSRPASRCRPTAAWCRGSTSRARLDRRGRITQAWPGDCCGSCWSNAPGVMLRYNAWARASISG